MNNILQQAKQAQLKYKNKIIQLQKEIQYLTLRASEYQSKFKEAVMQNSTKKGDKQLLQKICEKQSEIIKLRKQLMDANRQINNPNTDRVDQLISQNSQMRKVVQQLKNAAIAAIMQKDSQIQQLKRTINETMLSTHISQLQQKNHQLEEQIKRKTQEYDQQIKSINEKLMNQRNKYSQKLIKLQRQISNEENQKQNLIQKAQSLEQNVEDLEKVVQKYQKKLHQLQNRKSQQKIKAEKLQYQLLRKIETLQEDVKMHLHNQQLVNQKMLNLNKIIEDLHKNIQLLNDQKQELDRKLKIKNRKNNVKESSKSIFDSFEGFSQKADVYASFSRRQSRDAVKQSFIGEPIKLSDIKQIQIEDIQNFSQYVDIPQNAFKNRKCSDSTVEVQNSQIKMISQNKNKQNQQPKPSIDKTMELQQKIRNLLNQIQSYNLVINNLTKQLQKQRQDKLELKQKHSNIQCQFKVQKQSLRLHIYKLENALLVEKLQNAQKLQSNKQIREYEKKLYEDQITKLKEELQTPKKKKGFFNK